MLREDQYRKGRDLGAGGEGGAEPFVGMRRGHAHVDDRQVGADLHQAPKRFGSGGRGAPPGTTWPIAGLPSPSFLPQYLLYAASPQFYFLEAQFSHQAVATALLVALACLLVRSFDRGSPTSAAARLPQDRRGDKGHDRHLTRPA